jgi:DNA damage-binding protein 1
LAFSLPAFCGDFVFFTTERGEYALISHEDVHSSSTSGKKSNGEEQGEEVVGKHYPVKTHASGSFTSYSTLLGGTSSECGPLFALEEKNRCIALHLYDGWITIIPIHGGYDASHPKKGAFGEAFHVRVEERTILSIAFLKCSDGKGRHLIPQLALLHQDARGFQHVISHGVDLAKKSLIHNATDGNAAGSGSEKPAATVMPPISERLKKTRIDGGSAAIVAVPPSRVSSVGGVLILGQRQITYHHTGEGITRTLPISGLLLLTYCMVDETNGDGAQHKYLLGDEMGRLHVLTLLRNVTDGNKGDGCITTLLMETLGTASSSASLVYLGGGNLFLGSQFADSQLVKILDAPVPVSSAAGDDTILEDTTYVKVIEEYTNLGPIVDFDLRPCGDDPTSVDKAAMSGNQHRQSLLATCSGVGKDGSVRLVRNGVGMREFAEVEMPGIKGMWSLRRKFADKDDSFLVQSFVRETRILGVQSSNEEDMDEEGSAALAEVMIPGFYSSKSTLFAGNMLVDGNDLMVQVVQDGVRVVASESLELVSQWSPFSDEDVDEDGQPLGLITVASANESGQVVVSLHGGILIYLLVEGTAVRKVRRTTLDREISCIDLNPFDLVKDDNAMDVDSRNDVKRSQLVAVGLWDDFSVRLLSLTESNTLDQVLHISLGVVQDKTDMEEDNIEANQHMMARSLCLVSLDSIAASSSSLAAKKGGSASAKIKSNMLLVGLGDGKLISFVVAQSRLADKWSVHSRKEVSLGTHGINLLRLQNGGNIKPEVDGTCVLATGDRPTVVYLTGGNAGSSSNPKLCYSTISLTVDEDNEEAGQASHRNISVNAASSFRSSLLFSSGNSTSDNNYSLCVADENTLRLGVIDDVQKLHVTSYKLGMTPRRIAYHEAGRVYCVGCIDGNAEGGSGNQIGAEMNMGNCVRFFDDSTFEEINMYVCLFTSDQFYNSNINLSFICYRIKLEPFETILTLVTVSLCTRSQNPEKQDDAKDCKPYILIGTAYAYPDEDEPTQGRVIVVECNNDHVQLKSDDENDAGCSRFIRQVTHMPTRGAVYCICPFYNGTAIVTVNSKTHLCELFSDNEQNTELKFVGAGHHGHMMSLFVSSLARSGNEMDGQEKQLAIVGDLMRSISLVEYLPKHNAIEELARDYNSNFCTAIEMLTKDIYLGSEGYNNLFLLRHNSEAKSEEARVRLDTVGEYHLGEMPNKFKIGSLIMPSQQGCTSSDTSGSLLSDDSRSSSIKASLDRQRKIDIRVGSQTLFATVDGTIGSILGINGPTFAFLATLQRAMNSLVKSVGGLNHDQYRAFRAERSVRPSRGFIDGDMIETFLDLNRPTMEKIVQFMNDDGRWRIRDNGLGFSNQNDQEPPLIDSAIEDAPLAANSFALTVENVLCFVEEMSMMH